MKKVFVNKKKINFFNLNFNLFFFLILIGCVLIFLWNNFDRINKLTINLIEEYSSKYEYTLKEIKISKLKHLNENEILEHFDTYQGKSIFLIPLQTITNKISKNKWIKELKINSNYKNSIYVFVDEEKPFAIYDNSSQMVLFSENLVALKILKQNNKFLKLPIFYGPNSLNNSKELFKNLNPDLKKMIKSATFIENRRWDLKLLNNIIIKLPEQNIEKALKKYEKIHLNFSNNDLTEIESIDLRVMKKAIIKYKSKIND